MSIWADIHKRSNGLSERKEDIAVKEEQKKSNDFTEEQGLSAVWATYFDDAFEDNDKSWDSYSFGNHEKFYRSIWKR